MRRVRLRRLHLKLIFVGMFAAFSLHVLAKPTESSKKPVNIYDAAKPSLSHFTNRDGLPVNGVISIERDRRGFIWFGTQDGAAVFNGYDFSVVNMPNRATSNYIFDILSAKDGSLWFATGAGGVHQLKQGVWKVFDSESGLANNETRTLLETTSDDGKQVIWVGRRDGLSRLSDGRWENFDKKNGLPDQRVRSILETIDKQGDRSLWIGTYGGLALWRGKSRAVYDENTGLPGKIVFSLLETKNGRGESVVWAGTDKGLAKFENDSWQTFEKESEALTKPVRALGQSKKADGTETIWVGFDGKGLAFLENDQWKYLDVDKGLPSGTVMGIAEAGSPDGSVWISNLGAGVSRVERSNWRSLDSKNGLPNDIVFDIDETVSATGEKEFWFGTYGGGLARFSSGTWTIFNKDNGLQNDYVSALLSTKDENGVPILYVGTEKGLMSFQNGNWKEIDLGQKAPLLEIWDIKESEDEKGRKRLLIAASVGLLIRTGDGTERIDSKNGLSDDRVRAVLETVSKNGKKTLWAATYNGGLSKFEDGEWSTIDKNSGLLTNRVYAVSEIRFGNTRQLWVGTGGGGIAVLDLDSSGMKFRTYTTENSNLVSSDTVYKILQDARGRIYASTNRGVSRITPNSNGEISNFNSYFFTTEDGLPDDESVSGAGFVDSKGAIWIGTVGGAAVFDVSGEFQDETAEPLFLEKVLIGGKERILPENADLSYSENNIVFEYVMPTNFRESATRYRTQMVKLEEKPTEWTEEPRREFTFIPSGNFTFKIWGKDANGNISKPLEIAFRIRPAWWKTWWALLLYLFATAAIVAFVTYLVYRNRYLRMLEIERVRTRIAADLHDDVGASLSKISILSEVLAQGNGGIADDDRESLEAIANTSRDVVGSMSDMVWSINPNRDNMRDTVQRMRRFASEVLSARDIDFTFVAPEDQKKIKLDVDVRRQLYLVFKESLNNIAKHSECTEVTIELVRSRDEISLEITDNGKGFGQSELRRGNGLINMRSRTEVIGGTIEIDSEKGKGTSVTLKIPRRIGRISLAGTT